MSAADLATFRACTGREHAPTAPAREAFVVAGRRSGKSRIASAIAAYTGALAPTDRLAPGETGVVLVVAPTREQAGVIVGYVKGLFRAPALAPLVVDETADSLRLRHAVEIQVRSSNFRHVRGLTLLAAIVDECAFLRDESSAVPDLELYRALVPALAATRGLFLGISSPWAARGLLHAKHKRHFGHDGPTLVWQASSLVMHPSLDAELIAEAHADDPESAAAEWDACFRSDLESFVSTAVLDLCTTPGAAERPPVPGISYCGFTDPSGGAGKDSFTAAVAHVDPRDDGAPFVVLDAIREVKPPFDPLAIAAELAAFFQSYAIDTVQSDRFAGAWVSESFQRHGVAVVQDAEPKSALYLAALPVLTSQRCDLLDVPRLRSQFAALERRRRAGGRDSVDHPGSGHDDLCNSVAGVIALAVSGALSACEPLATGLARTAYQATRWDQV